MNYSNGLKAHASKLSRFAAFAATLATGLAHGASFPDFPLQTGTGSVPPNIMFILDDSGSMQWDFLPGAVYSDRDVLDNSTGPVAFGASTYTFNSLYYNPAMVYRPWLKADGSRAAGGTSVASVYADTSLLAQQLSLYDYNISYRTFYVPKAGATNLAAASSYYRYQIQLLAAVPQVVRSEYLPLASSVEGLPGVGCDTVGTSGWRNCTYATPTGRTAADESTNFATWFSFSRTRMKAAKAGASQAFGDLGENFRVGYDSIWNRNGVTAGTSGLPVLPIPVGTDGGLFRGANKTSWFDFLQRAVANDVTPLHGALQRTGNYYETQTDASGPWGPQSGDAQLSCRQSYAILTTDGYWNSGTGYTPVGDVDSTAGSLIQSPDGSRTYTYQPTRPYMDGQSDTLADVAMNYWKRDLRPTLPNNVPYSVASPAFWQNMVTFGITIGADGTLDPVNDVPLITAGLKSWPDVWGGAPLAAASWLNDSPKRVDDLLHATINGRGRFTVATDPDKFTAALKTSLAVIQRRRASGSNVTSNGPLLDAGSEIFQATYTSGEWSGDVAAISIVGGVIAQTSTWSMADVAKADTRPYSARGVFTWGATSGTTFPTVAQTAALTRVGGLAPVTGASNAAYVKGDNSGEKRNGGTLRDRINPVGDIVNSSPFYAKESASLFIGANDGMLHALDAKTGKVLFSYVPNGVNLADLASLSDPDYQHKFFVDGGVDVSTLAQGQGSNILAGSLGRGGRGVFALNVTSPSTFDASKVLWDRSGAAADVDMGYVLGSPLVRKGSDGSTLVMVGNGIESNASAPANSRAYLFIYRLSSTGTILSVIKAPAGSETGNGLAEPRAADTNGDGIVDYVYAGDLKGNVWKFDLTGNPTGWDNGGNIKRLFTATDSAGNREPITSAVALARQPLTSEIFITFGTGQYITNGDLTSTATQSIYGLIDSGTTISGRSSLQARTIASTGVDSLGRAARAWEPYSVLPTGKLGWYIDLTSPAPGERVVSAPFIKGRAMQFSSIIPKVGNACESGGTGYFNSIDAFTGTNPQGIGGTGTSSFIDVNGDGTGNDRLAGSPATGDTGYVGSVDLGIGMPGQGTGVGNTVYLCGSEAECGKVSNGGGADAKRLSWRELFKRD